MNRINSNVEDRLERITTSVRSRLLGRVRDFRVELCDAGMVAQGITRARLPAHNEVICTLSDPRTAELASRFETTRSAAALELWRDRLGGSIVVIGNAPTALFHLLEMLEGGAAAHRGCPRRAAAHGLFLRWSPP